MSKSELTRDEFAATVSEVLASVHHLYKQVHLIVQGLRDALAAPPHSLMPLRGTLSKGSKDTSRLVIRDEFGMLFGDRLVLEGSGQEDDDADDEGDDGEDGDEAEIPKGKKKRPPVTIESDQPLLVVRIVVRDPTKNEEPRIEYAVMSEWKSGEAKKEVSTLALKRNMLRRIPWVLEDAVSVGEGQRIQTAAIPLGTTGKGKDRQISAAVRDFASVPLYAMETPDALASLSAEMKSAWSRVSLNQQ